MNVSQFTIDLIKQRMAVIERMGELSWADKDDRLELQKLEERNDFLETMISSSITTDALESRAV